MAAYFWRDSGISIWLGYVPNLDRPRLVTGETEADDQLLLTLGRRVAHGELALVPVPVHLKKKGTSFHCTLLNVAKLGDQNSSMAFFHTN